MTRCSTIYLRDTDEQKQTTQLACTAWLLDGGAGHTDRPYEYGEFRTPFLTEELGGGSYDPVSGMLYLTVQKADREQGEYANPPIVIAYSFDVESGESPLTIQLHSDTVQHNLYGIALLMFAFVGLMLLFVSRRKNGLDRPN